MHQGVCHAWVRCGHRVSPWYHLQDAQRPSNNIQICWWSSQCTVRLDDNADHDGKAGDLSHLPYQLHPCGHWNWNIAMLRKKGRNRRKVKPEDTVATGTRREIAENEWSQEFMEEEMRKATFILTNGQLGELSISWLKCRKATEETGLRLQCR